MSNARKGVLSANEKTEDRPQIMPNKRGDLEPEHDTDRYTEAAPTYSITGKDRPIFIPIDRNWYHLRARNAPLVRQSEFIQRPPGVYIGPFNNAPPTENVADHNKDHNWRRKEESPHHRKEAVLKKNWPKPRANHKHDEYISKQHRPDQSYVKPKREQMVTKSITTWITQQGFGLATYLNGSQ